MNEDWRASYDAWKTTEPPEGPPSKPLKYRCLDCAWHGAEAYAHHRETRHHRIVLRDAPHLGPLAFGCCSELAAPEIRTQREDSPS